MAKTPFEKKEQLQTKKEHQPQERKAPQERKEQPQESADFRYIVRVANTDLDGKKPIKHALMTIKGVGYAYSNMVCSLSSIDRNKRTGDLTEEEIGRLDMIVRNPGSYGAPPWLFNHRKDADTGADMHFVSSDLQFSKDNDIKMLKMIKTYRGLRHQWAQPVRGQRTRSNFRANKGKGLGVKRKKEAKKGRV